MLFWVIFNATQLNDWRSCREILRKSMRNVSDRWPVDCELHARIKCLAQFPSRKLSEIFLHASYAWLRICCIYPRDEGLYATHFITLLHYTLICMTYSHQITCLKWYYDIHRAQEMQRGCRIFRWHFFDHGAHASNFKPTISFFELISTFFNPLQTLCWQFFLRLNDFGLSQSNVSANIGVSLFFLAQKLFSGSCSCWSSRNVCV